MWILLNLAASPDRIVFEAFQNNMYRKGWLEVKCPSLCRQKSMAVDSRCLQSFCIKDKNGKLSLSKSYAYYYQIQMQMHMAKLPWCDFVVWSPVDDLFVQHVQYNEQFMSGAISKAGFLFQCLFSCSCTLCHHFLSTMESLSH